MYGIRTESGKTKLEELAGKLLDFAFFGLGEFEGTGKILKEYVTETLFFNGNNCTKLFAGFVTENGGMVCLRSVGTYDKRKVLTFYIDGNGRVF